MLAAHHVDELPDAPLVDLGEDFAPVEAPGWPAVGGRRWRRWRPVVLAAVLIALVGASAPALAAPLREVAVVPLGSGATLLVDDDELYAYDAASGAGRLRALPLDGTGPRWTSDASEPATEISMAYDDGVVIVTTTNLSSPGPHTQAFDALTGHRLWSTALGSATVTGSGVLVDSASPPGGVVKDGDGLYATYEMRDPRTGRALWSVPVSYTCIMSTSGAALVALCPLTGVLRTVDFATGRTVASRVVPLGDPAEQFRLPATVRLLVPQLVIAPGVIIVAHGNVPTPTMDGYDAATLVPLWSGLPMLFGQDFEQCGDRLCVYDGDASGVVVDLRTGREIGLVPPPGHEKPADGALVLIPYAGDATTQVRPYEIRSVPAGESVSAPAAELDRMWLEAWHAADATAVPLAPLADVGPGSCVALGAYLTCATGNDQLTVWDLPR